MNKQISTKNTQNEILEAYEDLLSKIQEGKSKNSPVFVATKVIKHKN